MQEDVRGIVQLARYKSVTFTATEMRYSQPKLELAGVAKMLKKLQYMIWGIRFTLKIDASGVIQMLNAPQFCDEPMVSPFHSSTSTSSTYLIRLTLLPMGSHGRRATKTTRPRWTWTR
jgi:hypothetical protein